MGGLLHLVQLGGTGPAQAPLQCTKFNSPPINDQYNGPLLCSFNMGIKGWV